MTKGFKPLAEKLNNFSREKNIHYKIKQLWFQVFDPQIFSNVNKLFSKTQTNEIYLVLDCFHWLVEHCCRCFLLRSCFNCLRSPMLNNLLNACHLVLKLVIIAYVLGRNAGLPEMLAIPLARLKSFNKFEPDLINNS